MMILFIISGYCSGFKHENDIKDSLIKKIKRLLIPYIFWSQLCYFLSLKNDHLTYNFINQISSIYNSQFWFLRILFIFQVIFLGLIKIEDKISASDNIKKKKFCYYAIYIGFVFICVLLSLIPGQNGLRKYSLYFILGYFIHKKRNINLNKSLYIVNGLIFAALIVLLFKTPHNSFLYKIVFNFLGLSGCFLLYSVVNLLNIENKFLEYLGKNSLSLYAIHWCLFFACGIIDWNKLYINYGINIYALSMFVSILWILGFYMLDIFIKKYHILNMICLGNYKS